MLFDVTVAGFEGRSLQVGGGLRERPYLLVDGLPPPTGSAQGEYAIPRADGAAVTAVVRRARLPLDPVPRLWIAGDEIAVRPPLTPRQIAWSAIPLLLVLTSGLLGAVVGAVATIQNLRRFRRGGGGFRRTLGVSAAAAALVAIVSAGGLFFEASGDQAEADRAVAHLHEQLDRGSFEDILQSSDPLFTSGVSHADAIQFFSAIHTKLGATANAHLDAWREAKQLNGSIGTGTFMEMTYTTQFANGQGREQFIWRVTNDRRLLLVGYHVESPVFLR